MPMYFTFAWPVFWFLNISTGSYNGRSRRRVQGCEWWCWAKYEIMGWMQVQKNLQH